MAKTLNQVRTPRPAYRRLRAFAFDPILSRDIDTHDINEVTIKLPWEDDLEPGPVDEYLAVVDYDPASQVFYPPVDLNDKHLLAQDGFPPSERSPQFHQQMVYAVARNTIRHFEMALGRRALWSARRQDSNRKYIDGFVKQLRIYPHAMREANAYYSPSKKALLFGYFPASMTDPGENLPGGTVFTCLSHDIIAHETTHALLDGLHPRFNEPTNVDVWALHEAFADIVALFQHFTYPDVLHHQIARTRGDLESQNLLGELAFQFGQAIGNYGALRSAIGRIENKEWIPEEPNPQKILTTTEPHDRGAILVAAVFEAFLIIYKRRIADLLRIATGGTGKLPDGDLHPDLVERLAQEASKTARHMLNMCIRALDYCPPVDINYGDYLRALITADADLVSDDRYHYRLAIVKAFRQRGIYPRDVRNLSEESLLWYEPDEKEQREFQEVFGNGKLALLDEDWGVRTVRQEIFSHAKESRIKLHGWFTADGARQAAKVAHLVLENEGDNKNKAYYRNKESGLPNLEVHSVRPARRIRPDGELVTDLVVEMTQRRRGYYQLKDQEEADSGPKEKYKSPDFIFRGGCTLLIDPNTARVRYCVFKRIESENRLRRTREFLTRDAGTSLRATYFGDPYRAFFQSLSAQQDGSGDGFEEEPFALLHRSFEQEEVK